MENFKIEMVKDDCSDFNVMFNGPAGSKHLFSFYFSLLTLVLVADYEGGQWTVRVSLPPDYPYKSPSIGFKNVIYHPNVDEKSGSVCLDVINQTWSPMYELKNIFEVFLPQLLAYPNAADPLNSDAAALMLENPKKYSEKVKEYVCKYAKINKTSMQDNPSTANDMDMMEVSRKVSMGASDGQTLVHMSGNACSGDISYDNDDEMSSLSELSEDEGNFDLDI